MTLRRTHKILAAVALAVLPLAATLAVGCHATSHAVTAAEIGEPRSGADLEAVLEQPGPVTVETLTGADWAIDRSGLINLDHPRAKAAGLTDGQEPIQIFLHALRHPRRGLFLVDSGVERAFVADPDHALIRGLAARFMNRDALVVRTDTATWLSAQPDPLAGVLLTHLHVDHVFGMRDVPRGTPIYLGPGENRERSTQNVFARPVIDSALEGHAPLRELRFSPDPSGVFEGVLDLFGDGTVWALLLPGHTEGSTAYLARTPSGPVLFTGDVCHTAFGWENGVEPGSFSHDGPKSAESLSRLRAFVEKHPSIDVRLGHQRLSAKASGGGTASAR